MALVNASAVTGPPSALSSSWLRSSRHRLLRVLDGEFLSVRITSPLGRTGGVGTVRIVAQIQRPSDATLAPVRFYVDGALFKTDDDGPPYAVEWTDENPFERRELAVEVEDSDGRKGRDTRRARGVRDHRDLGGRERTARGGRLRPQGQLRERSELGRASPFEEDGVAQAIDLVSHERVPATFALLIDSSQSMSRRFDFVKDAAARLTAFLRPKDSVVVAPFAKRLGALTGPTSDRRTIIEAIQDVEPSRRHGHSRCAHRAQRTSAASRGPALGHPHQRWL